jgi:hypothetical protein
MEWCNLIRCVGARICTGECIHNPMEEFELGLKLRKECSQNYSKMDINAGISNEN